MVSVIRFFPGGGVRAVWDDAMAGVFSSAFGDGFASSRRRAGLILTVEEGRWAGCFYADMSMLADLTGDDSHRLCLYPPRGMESDCKKDEAVYARSAFVTKEDDHEAQMP